MLRSRLLARSIVVLVVFVGPALATSCGGSSSEQPAGTGGSSSAGSPGTGGSTGGLSGTAGMAPNEPITCGADTCQPVSIPVAPNYIAPCCADGDVCGLDATPLTKFGFDLNPPCQPLHQPGDLDDSCPPSAELMVPSSSGPIKGPGFPGCCRADTHTCGYQMDKALLVISLGLGCVDSSPFLEGGAPMPCGNGAAGAAGTGN